MNDPLRVPDLLRERPDQPKPGSFSNDRIHDFDLEEQCAPTCPEFRGVHVFRDFLDAKEAEVLLRSIEKSPFDLAQSGKTKQHFGPKINFNKRKVNATGFRGLPPYADEIESRLRLFASRDPAGSESHRDDLSRALSTFRTMDVFVMRYLAQHESNLDFHADDTFAYGETILDLSLESDSVLTFLEGAAGETEADARRCVRVPLPKASLAVVFGRARFDWEHAILAYDIDGRRTSVTLRTLSPGLLESEAGGRVAIVVDGRPGLP
jgi:alkylated DNA repair dioxygenase AlkB